MNQSADRRVSHHKQEEENLLPSWHSEKCLKKDVKFYDEVRNEESKIAEPRRV